jgi:hypothetical protein
MMRSLLTFPPANEHASSAQKGVGKTLDGAPWLARKTASRAEQIRFVDGPLESLLAEFN